MEMTDEGNTGEQRVCHIRVKGRLDDEWTNSVDGLAHVWRENGETLLSGPVKDQETLYDVLNMIRDSGLPLLMVLQTTCPCPKGGCPRRGRCLECAANHEAKGKLSYCFRERSKWDRWCEALVHG